MSIQPPAEPTVTHDYAVVWSLPAYAAYVLPMRVLHELISWMEANRVDAEYSHAHHPVCIEQHSDGSRTIVYEREPRRSGWHGDDAQPDPPTVTTRLPLHTDPPPVPDLPDLTALGAVITDHPVAEAHHNMPVDFGTQICHTCTRNTGAERPATYPCPAVAEAAAAVGVEVYPYEP